MFSELFEKFGDDRQRMSGFNMSPGEYNIQRRMYQMFFEAGLEQAKNEILEKLESALENVDDSKPKTMYNSDKFRHAIKIVKNV